MILPPAGVCWIELRKTLIIACLIQNSSPTSSTSFEKSIKTDKFFFSHSPWTSSIMALVNFIIEILCMFSCILPAFNFARCSNAITICCNCSILSWHDSSNFFASKSSVIPWRTSRYSWIPVRGVFIWCDIFSKFVWISLSASLSCCCSLWIKDIKSWIAFHIPMVSGKWKLNSGFL